MSVDKLVDSTQLDADLTSVANAIRTKGGTSAQLAFPSGFVSAINAIPAGGGSEPIVKTYTTTLTAELNSYNILQAMGAKLKYKNSCVMMFVLSSSAAGGGSSYTNNNYYLIHSGTSITKCGLLQKSGKSAPSTLAFFFRPQDASGTWYTSMTNSAVNADGTFTFRAQTATVLAPIGAVCITVEVPSALSNGDFDLTLFGD